MLGRVELFNLQEMGSEHRGEIALQTPVSDSLGL